MGMRIEYRLAGGSIYTVLADDASTMLGDSISGYQPQLSKSPQQDNLYRSASSFIQDRGNSQWSIAFTVDRIHADAASALLFLITHSLKFANEVSNYDLRIIVDTQSVFFPNCALVRYSPEPHSDQSTKCAYEFHGSKYQSVAP